MHGRAPDFIVDPSTDVAGVDWILGTHWWPYQRGTFVTPPFAGYVSGHSTFSRAAAEVLTLLTGDEFFPGGMGTFDVAQNEFLVFEQGPTENMTLQWATYRDASDQTSLSRIWGGIHPPIDDIRGRIIGEKIGIEAFNLAMNYFNDTSFADNDSIILYPIPFQDNISLNQNYIGNLTFELYGLDGKRIYNESVSQNSSEVNIELPYLSTGIYVAKVINELTNTTYIKKVIKN